MIKITLVTITLLNIFYFSYGQTNDKLNFRYGLAHFDDIDGRNIGLNYSKNINTYFDLAFDASFGFASDFPNNFNLQDITESSFWYSKSNIIDFSVLPSLVFIRTDRHYFSFFVGLGAMHINTVDVTSFYFSEIGLAVSADVEQRTTLSRTLGITYNYRVFNQYFIGLDIRMLQPVKDKSSFFGLDNYRSLNVVVSKRF